MNRFSSNYFHWIENLDLHVSFRNCHFLWPWTHELLQVVVTKKLEAPQLSIKLEDGLAAHVRKKTNESEIKNENESRLSL